MNRSARSVAVRALATVIAAIAAAASPGVAHAQDDLVPEGATPSAAVLAAASAEHLTDAERREFRVRHGLAEPADLDTPARRALAAFDEGRWSDAALADEAAPAPLRLARFVRAGRHAEVIAATEGAAELALLALRARSLAALGRRDEALAIAARPEVAAARTDGARIEDVLAAVDILALRIRLDAAAAGEYPSLLAALARARQQIDRLDHRVRLREAQLLADRHAYPEAMAALSEALSLHPRAAEAWRLAGALALVRFDFDGAARAASALRRLDPEHADAAIIDANSALIEDDPRRATDALAPHLTRPDPPVEALAWSAAADASRYDFDAMRAALARIDALEPGSAASLVVVGRQLVFDRQYEEARATLARAAAREPAWALPRAELGLLSMQDGEERDALADLRRAVELDPHDERTVFTLKLAEQLASWNRIETAHFVIRHPDGDAALVARLLARVLDGMHAEICARLGHAPARRTLIDVMPDHRSFGVRITGLPRIHTIAVCTGPTIAIEIPKEGAGSKHLGLFDPLAVLRHEYVHTVTLSMTRNRIPHWLTEAVAVALEDTPRTFENCQMLAAASRRGGLFDLDEINWAFVRPKKPTDRAQAYAQGRWMVEYAEKRFGWPAMQRLLFSYAEGIREDEAMRRAFGVSRAEFHAGFLAWAGEEVRAWGLDPKPSMRELAMTLVEGDETAERMLAESESRRLGEVAKAWADAIGRPGRERFALPARVWPPAPMPRVEFDEATLKAMGAAHPEQPDLVELRLRRLSGSPTLGEDPVALELIERYARLRPVDPYPHRLWARIAGARTGDGLAAGGDDAAHRHLVELDLRSDKDNIYALAIARNRREAGDLPAAARSAERAVRMNPFDPAVRELAAAIAIESGDLAGAEVHIEALTALEPDRALHRQRLERVRTLRGAGAG